MQFKTTLKLMVLLSSLFCSALTLPSGNPQSDDEGFDPEGEVQEPDPDWSSIDEGFTGPEDNLGLGRYQYADILLMSWVPQPVDKWDYTLVDASTNNRHVKESGREHMTYFTRERFPDVAIVFTCTEGDVNYFFNDKLNVPIIGVEAFGTDYPLQQYLDHVFSIHGFWNRPEMWAHFFSHPRAFNPIIARVSREYSDYLEQWTPRAEYNPGLDNGFGEDTVDTGADYSDEGYSDNESINAVE